MVRAVWLVPCAVLAAQGCTSGAVRDAALPGTVVYDALPEEGLVVRYDPATGEVASVDVGREPTRVVRFGGQLVVSLRAARALAMVDDTGDGLAMAGVVDTCAEPVGLAAGDDRLYVACYGADEVREYDADLEELRRFAVPGRPSWIALHPGGDALAVGAQVGGVVSVLDLRVDAPTPRALDVPEVPANDPEAAPRLLSPRVTGDPAYTPDGRALAAPLVFVDNTALPRHKTEAEALAQDPAARYEALGLGLGPNNPAIAWWPVDGAGQPEAGATLLYATGNAAIDDPAAVQAVRSMLGGVRFTPDGGAMLAPMEGQRVVVAMAADPAAFGTDPTGLWRAPTTYVGTGAEGPRGLAFTDDGRLWATHAVDRALVELPIDALRDALDDAAATGDAAAPTSTLVADGPPIPLADPALDAQRLYGERLFRSALDPLITTPLSGVSCNTCHFEGRNDGLGWMEVDGVLRQTLSLAGPLPDTAPYTWTNGVATVAEEVRITSQVRVGGRGASDVEFEAVAAYLGDRRAIDHANLDRAGADVDRGRALFLRADVGCAGCHVPPLYTDQRPHDLYGLTGVDTPTLLGVEATAPYLHDGSAPTLRDVLEGTTAHGMGDAAALSDAELDDLEAFLRSL